ncbi:hypothetical protein OS175_00070 [Marinicella sp. S1101]|uniref:hypothetical protein n=1 Tax=Marinicella marina TaxID=2996016 RepID=UPI0022609835|nr:hypothetical protein [Marinicella marina]MCX7552257.1 hypothetical protein [Marinicella marina]MDJ1139133.1 hypothetical protein [Marinicella marina]
MKRENCLIKAYGKNDAGWADLPHKVSGVFVRRITLGEESGCSFCFPHGYETYNWRFYKNQRCWKKQRLKQWKSRW